MCGTCEAPVNTLLTLWGTCETRVASLTASNATRPDAPSGTLHDRRKVWYARTVGPTSDASMKAVHAGTISTSIISRREDLRRLRLDGCFVSGAGLVGGDAGGVFAS